MRKHQVTCHNDSHLLRQKYRIDAEASLIISDYMNEAIKLITKPMITYGERLDDT